MNRILQLVWILVTYSIITESIDLKSLFEDLSSYKAENYNKPINTHIVKSDTKVIAVKCYNTNQNKQHNYNNVQRNFTYTPNKSNNIKRITIDFTDSDYFWTVSTISKSGDQDISCGILQVNTNVHELKYKYTIPDENNITKLEKKEMNSITGQNNYFFAYSESEGLRNYYSLSKIAEDDLVYVFKIDGKTPDQVLEPESIIENPTPPPPLSPTKPGDGKNSTKDDETKDDTKNSTAKIRVLPSIIFSIMFIINKIIY